MKILYLSDFYYPNKGGIENLLSNIINYFSDKNTVFLITWKFSSNLPEIEEKEKIIIYRLQAKNLYEFYIKAYFFAKKLIKQEQIDIIHSHSFLTHLIAGKLGKKYNKKVFCHIHGMFGRMWDNLVEGKLRFLKSWKFQYLEKKVCNLKNVDFICVSKYVYDVMKFTYGVEDDNLHLIYNGIDKDKFFSYLNENKIKKIRKKIAPNNEFVFLFYGRQEKVKNLDILLKIFQNLNLPNSKLIILLSNFSDKKINFTKYKNIEIYPAVKYDEIPNWIKASNVVVFPSLIETFGYVALETGLLKTPLVASFMGGIPEVAYGKVNLFNPFDEEDFKQALVNAYKGKFENIPEKDFSIYNTLNKMEHLYFKN